jgi:ribosomal protein S17E
MKLSTTFSPFPECLHYLIENYQKQLQKQFTINKQQTKQTTVTKSAKKQIISKKNTLIVA